MSRHEIAGHKPGLRVAVGWDQPLLTYFVHVFDAGWKREGPTIWLGFRPRELYDIGDLKRAIQQHADLPRELLVTLRRDRDEGR